MNILNLFKKQNKENLPFQPFSVVLTEKGDYNSFQKKLLKYSLIMLINGKRGSGKTALGMRFLELYNKKTKRKCYTLGYKDSKLPRWIKKVDTLDKIPNNSVVLIDEGGISYSARDSMKQSHKELSKIMAIARHKNLIMILITQNSAMIDLNVLRLADTILLKEPSLLQSKFERKAIKEIYDKAIPHFNTEKKQRFYCFDDEFEGLLKHDLPEFWTKNISESFKNF
jgi:ABC-type oligopeptide transport system ATPase subunit